MEECVHICVIIIKPEFLSLLQNYTGLNGEVNGWLTVIPSQF